MKLYILLSVQSSLSGFVPSEDRDRASNSTERLFKGKRTCTHALSCTDNTTQHNSDRESLSVRGKNTEIKRGKLVVFNLEC